MTTGTIYSERIDDVSLLMHWMLKMQIGTIIDAASTCRRREIHKFM
ncbi:MAG: hypothetical protein ACOYL7_07565 [Caldilinea sp.]|jgi:hypothetical protein